MITHFFILFILMITLNVPILAKIRLMTFHFNRPDFIELQYKTFKKFLVDDFELIVFNDARSPDLEIAIREACEKYGIKCVRYEQHWHENHPLNDQVCQWVNDPNIYCHIGIGVGQPCNVSQHPCIRHCHVIQYALDNYGYNHNDIVAIVDGDLFAIRPFSLRSLLANKHIVGIQRLFSTENVDYLWVVFTAVDMRTLPNKKELKFHVDVIDNKIHDTGSHTYHFLRNNPKVRAKKYLGHSSTCFYRMPVSEMYRHGFNEQEIGLAKNLPWPLCVEFHLEHRLLHYGASSFEHASSQEKSNHVKSFLKKILDE